LVGVGASVPVDVGVVVCVGVGVGMPVAVGVRLSVGVGVGVGVSVGVGVRVFAHVGVRVLVGVCTKVGIVGPLLEGAHSALPVDEAMANARPIHKVIASLASQPISSSVLHINRSLDIVCPPSFAAETRTGADWQSGS